MKTLDKLYELYCDDNNLEVERRLCKRLKKLATIVLKQFKIFPYHQNFEDYLQTAYLTFWEILPEYNPHIGKLEGFFMISFKHRMINIIKDEVEENCLRSDMDVDALTTEWTVWDMYYVEELKSKLTEAEINLLYAIEERNSSIAQLNNPRATHLEVSLLYDDLAEEFGVTPRVIKDQIVKLSEKLFHME